MTPDAIVRGQIALARALEPALSAVIDNHLDTATPVVVDGDYIVPGSVVHPAVRSVVVHEDDVQQLTTNYLAREPEMGDQRERAEASVAYGRWLAGEARRHAIPVLPARPWATAFDRLLTALDLTTTSAS
jgi:2-phosphoglycerate kinase